jgi:hypothetical protein
MNVEIGAEAALFPEKEYINGIFVTVQGVTRRCRLSWLTNAYEPKCWERGGGRLLGLSQLYTGAQIKFVSLPPYLTYAWRRINSGLSI